VINDVTALRRFSTFLDQALPTVDTVAGVDRLLLKRYLDWLATQPCGHDAKEDAVTGLHLFFFSAIRQHGWDDTLPDHRGVLHWGHPAATALLASAQRTPHGADRAPGQPRPLAPPRRTADHPNPDPCGLRASDACTLAFDCLVHDGQGAPYLRYLNHKMRREAAVPIDDELEAEIRVQQGRIADRWPDNPLMPVPPAPRQRGRPASCTYYSYRTMLNRGSAPCWLEHARSPRSPNGLMT
jgi:hypothetical protein